MRLYEILLGNEMKLARGLEGVMTKLLVNDGRIISSDKYLSENLKPSEIIGYGINETAMVSLRLSNLTPIVNHYDPPVDKYGDVLTNESWNDFIDSVRAAKDDPYIGCSADSKMNEDGMFNRFLIETLVGEDRINKYGVNYFPGINFDDEVVKRNEDFIGSYVPSMWEINLLLNKFNGPLHIGFTKAFLDKMGLLDEVDYYKNSPKYDPSDDIVMSSSFWVSSWIQRHKTCRFDELDGISASFGTHFNLPSTGCYKTVLFYKFKKP